MSENGPKIRLVLLWHMHQPFYKDMVTGEYRLPWVRLHALKDYYGMVKLVEEFPDVHQNFNLVPSLVAQIQDYASGEAHDPFFDLVSKPASELTASERRFALQYLFQANPVNMIGRYPRYRELWERYRATDDRPEGAGVVLRDPRLRRFAGAVATGVVRRVLSGRSGCRRAGAKGRRVQPRRSADSHCQAAGNPGKGRAGVCRGGAAGLGRAIHDSLLPPDSAADLRHECRSGIHARVCRCPTRRFRRPEDAAHQIQRAIESHEQTFGARPVGLWPSEGSVSEEVLALAHKQGIQWMATDEGVLGRTIGYNFARDGSGRLHGDSAEQLYNIHRYEKGDTRMNMVFRDHTLSDLIGFVYSGMPAQDAANHLIHSIRECGAAGAGTRPRCGGVDHSGWRECLGILPAVWTRVSAPLLRRPAARSADRSR